MASERFVLSSDGVCPSCERKATRFEEFPRVKIQSVTIIPPPSSLIRKSDDFHGGSYDFTSAIRKIYEYDQVQEYLKKLQTGNGQVVNPEDLMPAKEAFEVNYPFPWKDLVLREEARISLYSHRNDGTGCFVAINVGGVWGTGRLDLLGHPGRLGLFNVSFDLAKVGYKGLFLASEVS